MRRTEQAQGLRLMKFEEVCARTTARLLSQAEAAEVLGVSEQPLQEIVFQHQVHPNQVGAWKRQVIVDVRAQTVTAVLRAGCYAAGRYSHPRSRKAESSTPGARQRQGVGDGALGVAVRPPHCPQRSVRRPDPAG